MPPPSSDLFDLESEIGLVWLPSDIKASKYDTLEKHWEVRKMIVSASCMNSITEKRTWVFLISSMSVLMTSIYKIIAKILADRICDVLNIIMSSYTISLY